MYPPIEYYLLCANPHNTTVLLVRIFNHTSTPYGFLGDTKQTIHVPPSKLFTIATDCPVLFYRDDDISGCYIDELLTKTVRESGRFYKVFLSLEMKKVIQTFAGGKIGLG
jgi:hypothetical protein